ncbi:MAG: hypothetical protein QOE99_3472 [Actinomycetota bacterium]|jgi:hypothetical protein|nr:hypothetical protein [Actinomycetota bacterium]
MIRKTAVAAIALGVLSGMAAPALANGDESHVCIVATHDRNHPGPSVICVVVPVDKAH